ncbi:MAG: hypothetical protein ACRD3V_25555 [Vicinamibacteria bacterium]
MRRYTDEILINTRRRLGYSKERVLDTIRFAFWKSIIDFDEIIG